MVKNLLAVQEIPVRFLAWEDLVFLGFPGGSAGKESVYKAGDLGWEDPLEKGKAALSSILAWRIPWTV